jgi:hypothetical protein
VSRADESETAVEPELAELDAETVEAVMAELDADEVEQLMAELDADDVGALIERVDLDLGRLGIDLRERILELLTTVNFRVVGVYLGSVPGDPPDKNTTGDVRVTVFGNDPSVKRIVDAVERKANRGSVTGVSGFRYATRTTSSGDQILDEVEVEYTRSPKRQRGYPPGTYALRQQLSRDPQRVFQYYVYDVEPRSGQADAVRRKNTDNTFVPFDQPPTNGIDDGDYVVWRLLTIRTEPENAVPEESRRSESVGLPEGIIRTNSRLSQLTVQGVDDAEDGESDGSSGGTER